MGRPVDCFACGKVFRGVRAVEKFLDHDCPKAVDGWNRESRPKEQA